MPFSRDRRVTSGDKQVVKVSGLEPGEIVSVVVDGSSVDFGQANDRGRVHRPVHRDRQAAHRAGQGRRAVPRTARTSSPSASSPADVLELLLVPTLSAAAPCATAEGVSVVVDFNELGGGVQQVCLATAVGDQASDLFPAAGFPLTYAQRQPGFVCRVSRRPRGGPVRRTPRPPTPTGVCGGATASRASGPTPRPVRRRCGSPRAARSPSPGTRSTARPGPARRRPRTTSRSPSPDADPDADLDADADALPARSPSPSPTPTQPPSPTPVATPSAPVSGAPSAFAAPLRSPSASPTTSPSRTPTPQATEDPTAAAPPPSRRLQPRTAEPGDDGLPVWVAPAALGLLAAAGAAASSCVRRRPTS